MWSSVQKISAGTQRTTHESQSKHLSNWIANMTWRWISLYRIKPFLLPVWISVPKTPIITREKRIHFFICGRAKSPGCRNCRQWPSGSGQWRCLQRHKCLSGWYQTDYLSIPCFLRWQSSTILKRNYLIHLSCIPS